MAAGSTKTRLRVGWWAGAEPPDPLAALRGSLLRAEISARSPSLGLLLVHGSPASWWDPGFTGELAASQQSPALDLFVASGAAEPGGPKLSHALSEAGTATVAIAPEEDWALEPRQSVGPPFAMPEPALLAARQLSQELLDARRAYLRVVEGLPRCYVLVEDGIVGTGGLFGGDEEDLDLALAHLSKKAAAPRPAEVVVLAPGPLSPDDPEVTDILRLRRAEEEEGRYQAEDWAGWQHRPRLPLRVTSPADLAAAVSGAAAVVARSGGLMALAWALGVPHVALGAEGSAPSNFAAWTGDASALALRPADVVATTDNIFARKGTPPGLKRLEATLDEALDEAAAELAKAAAGVTANGRGARGAGVKNGRHEGGGGISPAERAAELEAINEALRMRLAAERARFGERAALLERTAHTTVESAIKAVHGQDVIIRRKLEQTEKEMRRLQEETAQQQAELRAIYSTKTMRALAPARQWYERLRKASDGLNRPAGRA